MGAYILRRIGQMVPTLAGVMLLIFVLFNAVGGDPALVLAGKITNKEQIENIRKQLGVDQPYHVQLGYFAFEVATGFTCTWRSFTEKPAEPKTDAKADAKPDARPAKGGSSGSRARGGRRIGRQEDHIVSPATPAMANTARRSGASSVRGFAGHEWEWAGPWPSGWGFAGPRLTVSRWSRDARWTGR